MSSHTRTHAHEFFQSLSPSLPIPLPLPLPPPSLSPPPSFPPIFLSLCTHFYTLTRARFRNLGHTYTRTVLPHGGLRPFPQKLSMKLADVFRQRVQVPGREGERGVPLGSLLLALSLSPSGFGLIKREILDGSIRILWFRNLVQQFSETLTACRYRDVKVNVVFLSAQGFALIGDDLLALSHTLCSRQYDETGSQFPRGLVNVGCENDPST